MVDFKLVVKGILVKESKLAMTFALDLEKKIVAILFKAFLDTLYLRNGRPTRIYRINIHPLSLELGIQKWQVYIINVDSERLSF